MANRSYLYSCGIHPNQQRKRPQLKGISEWNSDIPLVYKVLVSAQTRVCKSSIWKGDLQIAISGDYLEGRKRLFEFLERIKNEETEKLIKDAESALGIWDFNREFFVLEAGEIFDLIDDDLEEQNKSLFEQIQDLSYDIDKAVETFHALAGEEESGFSKQYLYAANTLGLDNWRDVLYYDFPTTSLISDFDDWNKASDAERLAEVEFLMQYQLKEQFDFLGFKRFRCNRNSNVIARFFHRETRMNFHLIPGGFFYPGATEEQLAIWGITNDELASESYIDMPIKLEVMPFLMAEYLLTEYAWKKFSDVKLFWNFGDDYPVNGVELVDIHNWCEKSGLMVPTELQWEYACRAGSKDFFYWGNEPSNRYAWVDNNCEFDLEASQERNGILPPPSIFKKVWRVIKRDILKKQGEYHTFTAVDQKLPNAFGLLGMLGNLLEYVSEDRAPYSWRCDGSNYDYSRQCGNDVLRGGSNVYKWYQNRTTYRVPCAPGCSDTGNSVRISMPLKPI